MSESIYLPQVIGTTRAEAWARAKMLVFGITGQKVFDSWSRAPGELGWRPVESMIEPHEVTPGGDITLVRLGVTFVLGRGGV